MLYRVRLCDDEFNTLKGLVLRWKSELEYSANNIEDIPLSMRASALAEFNAMIDKATNICREFGIEP